MPPAKPGRAVKGRQGQSVTETITEQVQALVQLVGAGNLQAGQFDKMFELIMSERQTELEMAQRTKELELGDLPNQRAYALQVWDYWLKVIFITAAVIVACVAIY